MKCHGDGGRGGRWCQTDTQFVHTVTNPNTGQIFQITYCRRHLLRVLLGRAYYMHLYDFVSLTAEEQP